MCIRVNLCLVSFFALGKLGENEQCTAYVRARMRACVYFMHNEKSHVGFIIFTTSAFIQQFILLRN